MVPFSPNWLVRVALGIVLLLSSGRPFEAQTAEPNVPVLKAETRQVLVDVVVRDHSGKFIPNLKPADFTMLEDGKPQEIAAFAMHAASPSAVQQTAVPPVKLPPNQYTNYAIADPQRPITIVLMDVLNTETQDQAYTRKQMIEFLRSLPPGERVALFVLGTRLQMIQAFTGESDTLVAAAKMLLRRTSPLMTSEKDRQDEEVVASNLGVNAGPGPTGPTGGGVTGSPGVSVATTIEQALWSEQNSQQTQRMELTLNALQALARAVSAYPGRKNLLWLSAEFPIAFGPSFSPGDMSLQQAQSGLDSSERVQDQRVNAPSIHQTAALLTASQIAVYPIDIRGTISTGTGIDAGTGNAYGSMERMGETRDRFAVRQTTMQWDDHNAMTDIARETGGKAFYGSNDIKAALSSSMDEGENYYTIAYAPRNHDWNGKYRKIEVKCSQDGSKLTYRRGYYAVANTGLAANGKVAEDQIALLFTTAMHPEAPTSTMILLRVQVLPPDADHKAVRIDYAISPSDVAFTDSPDGSKHVRLDLMAVAWDKNGKAAAEDSGKMDNSVSLDSYNKAMHSGVPAHQELQVKPGNYTLRVGVVDRNTRKIGTLDVPLTIPESQSSPK